MFSQHKPSVVQDEVMTTDGICEDYMLGRQDLTITNLDPPTINDKAVIVAANILANNGIVHIIDSVLIPPHLDLRKLGIAPDGTPLLLECEYDCDVDADCAPGLLCADQHKSELEQNGLDPRKAYCNTSTPAPGFERQDKYVSEVCYDPHKVPQID